MAEIEIFHSRPIAPTRRVAVGRVDLPIDPGPGPGGVLLAGIVARFLRDVDSDFHEDFMRLLHQLQRGERIPQPRLRHRLQVDRVGLLRSRHRLERHEGRLSFMFEATRGRPEQYVLGAAYAAGAMAYSDRPAVMDIMRRGARWKGPVDGRLISHLTGRDDAFISADGFADPVGWALGLLGFASPDAGSPERTEIQHRFRSLLRSAHPDTGGTDEEAAQRIADLTEARRILLG